MAGAFKEWTVLPHETVTRLDDDLLTVVGMLPMPLGDFPRRMTVVRLRDARLVVFSAIALDEPEMRALEDWGRPAFLIVPNERHRKDARIWKDRYPELVVICPEGARVQVGEVVPVDATDADFGDPAVRLVTVPGTELREAALVLRRPTGTTLVVKELIWNVGDQPGLGGWFFRHGGFTGDAPKIPKLVALEVDPGQGAAPGAARGVVAPPGPPSHRGVPRRGHQRGSRRACFDAWRRSWPTELGFLPRFGALLYPGGMKHPCAVLALGLLAACSKGGATGGDAGGGGAGSMGAINPSASVLERGKNPQRTAHFVEPALTTAAVMTKMAMDTTFTATFSGGVAGVPLFVAGAQPGQGRFFVATLSNNVYALDETTGAVIWMHSIGTGGHGIIGTPVIDAATRAIFVAADAQQGHHIIDALSIDTGDELAGWPVDVSTLSSNGVTFNSPDQNERGALSDVGGIVYVPYGGYYGDGGNYHGWVVAVEAKNPANVAGWATTGKQEGIWAPGGMASDGTGVFAVTGNNGAAPQDHLDSEEVVRVTGLALAQRDDANRFWPSIWRTGMDMGDKDFGSCSPLVVAATGGAPASLVVAPAKPGRVYFLDAKKLGGLGGQAAELDVANLGAESVYVTPTTYRSTSGLFVVISTTSGAMCPGGTKDSQLVGIKLDTATSPLTPKIVWCATVGGDDDIRRRSSISTTTDGHSNALVWFMNGSKLNAFDGETGAVVFAGGADDCGGIRRHTSPIAVNGRIIAAGDGHLCSWSLH